MSSKKSYNDLLREILPYEASYDLPPVLVNKVVLQQTHLFVHQLPIMAELSGERPYG